MPIHYASEPANERVVIEQGLNRLATRASPLSERGLDFSAMSIQPPQSVYDLRADAVAGGGRLSSAALTGFRYLVQNRGANVAIAEVVVPSAGASPVLANLNYGPYVEATARALAMVAGLAPVAQNSYEVRLLRFSAIGLMALWLKPDSGGSDIIYPLAPAPSGLQAEQPYSEEAFFNIVKPLAESRAAKRERGSVP
jgi:hypothetical protein